MLHSEHNNGGTSKVYVTDYTKRDDLAPALPGHWWDKTLMNRIVRIHLYDGQSEMAQAMQRGTFFNIKNLHLKRLKDKLFGSLGGSDRLITKVDPGNSDNKELAALLACVGLRHA